VREAGTWYDTDTDRLARQWAGCRVEECDQVEMAARKPNPMPDIINRTEERVQRGEAKARTD
jgi:hypothetical protein